MNELAREARKRLLDRRRALEQLARDVDLEEAEISQGNGPDPLDTAARGTPLRVLESLRNAQQQEITELDAALRRIEDGNYGTCEVCGGAVGRQRLRAIPEARYCIECVNQRSRAAAR